MIKNIHYPLTVALVAAVCFVTITASFWLHPKENTYSGKLVMTPAAYQEVTTTPELSSSAELSRSTVVGQGTRIFTSKTPDAHAGRAGCTVAYINPTKKFGITAAHCGAEGDYVWTAGGSLMGRIHHVHYQDKGVYHHKNNVTNDYTVFTIDTIPPYQVDYNKYSGDTVLSIDDIHPGDPVCIYGATSQRIQCHTVWRIDNGVVYITPNGRNAMPVVGGDSGGVVWIPRRGFVGVLHGAELVAHPNSGMEVEHVRTNYILAAKVPVSCALEDTTMCK